MNGKLSRRDILRYGAVGGALAVTSPVACGPAVSDDDATDAPRAVAPASAVAPFELDELSITELGEAMAAGRMTARDVTEAYLARIEALDRRGPTLRSVIEVNPEALDVAQALDRERGSAASRGPLHGIPILLKDNIDTADRMTTTAGSLALSGSVPPEDSTVASRLRDAGCGAPGQGQSQRMGQLPVDTIVQWLERPGRPMPEPVRARSQPLWIELRLGRRGLRQPCRRGDWHRDRRLDRVPVVSQRHRRHQAHCRTGESRGDHSHLPQPGHGRANGAIGSGCGGRLGCADRR